MKKIFKIFAILSIIAAAAGCTMSAIDTQMTPEKEAATRSLKCDALPAYTLTAVNPSPVVFRITSNTPWTITGGEDASWCTVSPRASAEVGLSHDITVKALSDNPDYTDRVLNLTISADKISSPITVTITQNRKAKLEVTPITDVFPSAGGQLAFKVKSNLHWEVSSSEDWLTFSEHSGEGDGVEHTVKAIAAPNTVLEREAVVTVTSGDAEETFKVKQASDISLKIQGETELEFPRQGGSILFDVDSNIDWTIKDPDPWFKGEKTADGKLKISAPFNNIFIPREGSVTIVPASVDILGVEATVTMTQEVNFTWEGNCVLADDGSLKLTGGDKARIVPIDNYRYITVKMTLGEKNFAANGEIWVTDVVSGDGWTSQLFAWITVGKARMRAMGTISTGQSMDPNSDSYISKEFTDTFGLDAFNAMEEYQVDFIPDETTAGLLHMKFTADGVEKCDAVCRDPFYDNDIKGVVTIGPNIVGDSTGTTETWYVVKTCEIISLD